MAWVEFDDTAYQSDFAAIGRWQVFSFLPPWEAVVCRSLLSMSNSVFVT